MSWGAPGNFLATSGGGNPAPGVMLEQPRRVFRYGESCLWSTARHAAAAALANSQVRLFSIAIGQTGLGLTNGASVSETNLRQPGVIPEGVGYDVFGISVLPMFGSATDDSGTVSVAVNTAILVGALLNLQQNCVIAWSFLQTEIDVACVHLIGAGGGAFGALSTTANVTTIGHMNNGAGSAWYYKQNPVALPGQSTFALLLKFGSRAAAVPTANDQFTKATLLGYYKSQIEVG